MKIKFWGTRGSLPTPGKSTIEYGGNTTCLEVISDSGDEYIFDAGTGIRDLGNDLMQRSQGKGLEAKLFLTHKHWDHVQGFPFFVPAYVPGNKIEVYSGDADVTQEDLERLQDKQDGVGTRKIKKGDLTQRVTQETAKITNKNNGANKVKDLFQHQQQKPYFPVTIDMMAADLNFKDIAEGEKINNGVQVSYRKMDSHPDGVFCYKITENNHSIVFATDYEHDSEAHYVTEGKDKKLIEWARSADILIYDGQYTPEEYDQKIGWGHSTYEKGIDIALEAGVKTLIFTHHDPMSTDERIKTMEDAAKKYLYQRLEGGKYTLNMQFAKEGEEYYLRKAQEVKMPIAQKN